MLDLKLFVCPVFMAELWVGATEHLHQPPHKRALWGFVITWAAQVRGLVSSSNLR